ncbi:OmpA family protein [Algoriphagus yeomjeoni]|uniref:OmpA family protein n=1 Tax=Algoriphagus yeomjeoni TaxID=291403 RepID=A0A327PD96_9BACT|nr:OmpA family protein [Algoriphagus yeomjeoni]RAI89467.1 OmpA family protein [Algoriphagus yeomjeoni]
MKKLILLILAFAFAFSAQAQLHGYKWRFGASAGTTNYLGDIRPFKLDNFQSFTKYYKRYQTYSDQLSYQVSIEYALGNSVGLMLTGGSYQFGSSDRFIQNDGTLFTESPSFDRALNFQTDVYDAGLSFVIKPDNNWLLSGKSFFAPYITLGAGVQSFNVHGDLLDANGNRYDYSNPKVLPDGSFETNLTNLGTERSDNYKTTSFYANLGLGVRFRITKTLEIFAQSDFKRTNTDYLDDVSGVYRASYANDFQEYAAKPGTNVVTAENPYRGMENGRPDWYIYHGIGIKFSLGANKTAFNPPVITQRYSYIPTEVSNVQQAKGDSVSVETISSSNVPVTNNYFTVVQLPSNEQSSIKSNTSELDSATLDQINAALDSIKTNQAELYDEIEATKLQIEEIDRDLTLALSQQDSSISAEETLVRLRSLESEKVIAQEKIKSLKSVALENKFKMNLVDALKIRTTQSSTLEYESMSKELLIYPGQVSRISYSSSPQILRLDSASQTSTTTETAAMAAAPEKYPETRTRNDIDEEMAKFRKEMLSAQATRDSAMIMAIANMNRPVIEAPKRQENVPQEFTINTQAVEDDASEKELEKNQKQLEQLQKKNNELLKDALLVGATAASTAAISSQRTNRSDDTTSSNDSTLRARIAMDSLIIDSLSTIPREVDTVTVVDTVKVTETEVVEKNIETLLNESKVEVYFPINAYTLSDREQSKLAPVSEYLKKNPEAIVELVGFADNTGSVSYNLTLTEKRVEAVTKTLTDFYEIDSDRITVSNGGLIVRGRSKGSVETDRKVEIRVLKK